ncbi:MAG: hypothetical protein K0M64_10335 [Rhizobium sp.]|nr:hypothetical protein [Rhizobium sp.]
MSTDVLDSLPEESREVLLLYYREGQSSRQVASLLGLQDAAVRKRLSRRAAAAPGRIREIHRAGRRGGRHRRRLAGHLDRRAPLPARRDSGLGPHFLFSMGFTVGISVSCGGLLLGLWLSGRMG